MSKPVKGTTVPTSGGSENTPKEEPEITLKNMSGDDIRKKELKCLAYILLKEFRKKQKIKIHSEIINNLNKNDSAELWKVGCAVLEAVQWLCNNGLIAPYISNDRYGETHFITRKGLKKLEEKQTTNGEMTNRTEKYTLYFQSLIDELREQHDFPNTRLVDGRHFHQFHSGMIGVYYVPGFRRGRSLSGLYDQGKRAYTMLGLWSNNRERNKTIFDALEERKSEIEARFGEELEWYRRDDITRSYIGLSREGDIDSDERSLEDIKKWHIENLIKLKYVFMPEMQRALDRL